MLRVTFLRHGQTDWNAQQRLQGQQNTPLNALGRAQARAAADCLRWVRFDLAYCSDLERARRTAEIVLAGRDLPLIEDPRLRERSFGCLESLTRPEMDARYPELMDQFRRSGMGFRPPRGESKRDQIERVLDFFDELPARHPNGAVLVVAHGGVLSAWLSGMVSRELGLDPPRHVPLFAVDNCSVSQLHYEAGHWQVKALNVTDHLRGLPEGSSPTREGTLEG